MKKVKISLVAIAFVLGIGGAFATQLAGPDDPCTSTTKCEGVQEICCMEQNGDFRPGELQNP